MISHVSKSLPRIDSIVLRLTENPISPDGAEILRLRNGHCDSIEVDTWLKGTSGDANTSPIPVSNKVMSKGVNCMINVIWRSD